MVFNNQMTVHISFHFEFILNCEMWILIDFMQKVSILTRTIVIYEQEAARRDLTKYHFQIIEIKIYSEDGAEAGDGAQVVLNFWADLRLAVLTRVVLTQKKACK